MIRRFRKVSKDLYRGSAPSPIDIVLLKNKIGLKKVVSLDARSSERINKICNTLNIKHITIPLEMSRQSLMQLFQYDLKQLLLDDGPTFVHCYHGKDRTGLVVALVKCKYFDEDPERAIVEAKTLGFGVGIDPRVTKLYEKLIRDSASNKDSNDADIVSNEREYIDDNRGSFLESGPMGSFAPQLDQTKTYPADVVYNYINDQSPTRENYQSYKNIPDIKIMNFPEDEYKDLEDRLDDNKPIYTTRVDTEADMWEPNQLVNTILGLLKIVDIKKIEKITDHPFIDELTSSQKNPLNGYNNMDVIKLIRVDELNRDVSDSINDVPQVGMYNNDAGSRGFGPVEPQTGFFYD